MWVSCDLGKNGSDFIKAVLHIVQESEGVLFLLSVGLLLLGELRLGGFPTGRVHDRSQTNYNARPINSCLSKVSLDALGFQKPLH